MGVTLEARSMTSPQHIWRPLPALIVAMMLLVGASACGGDEDDNGESFDAHQVVEDAAETLAAAETFRFELSHANGSTELIQDMEMTDAEGEVVSPDRLRADIDVTLLGQLLEIEVVGIGEQVWISNPFDASQWQLVPGTTAQEVLDLTVLPDVMRAVEDPQPAGIDEIDGQAHYRVRASVDSESLEDVIPAAARSRRDGRGRDLGRSGRLLHAAHRPSGTAQRR